MHLVIVVIFLISISIFSSATDLSFAKTDKDKYDNDLNDISSSSVDESKKNLNDNVKEPIIQSDLLNDQYPNQFYICGYPQQIISDYNSFEKINCDR
jgi:hypothetical protein